ncbi:hypothetical protein AY600_19800 [Phormidium willei BDU 130791]|nr:hypothetical protein AY600_19800 [Phormidium willei BDU 130791]
MSALGHFIEKSYKLAESLSVSGDGFPAKLPEFAHEFAPIVRSQTALPLANLKLVDYNSQ